MKKLAVSRSFGGKTDGFASKEEQRFEQAHLKAYKKGYETFSFGKDAITKHPIKFQVKEIWK